MFMLNKLFESESVFGKSGIVERWRSSFFLDNRGYPYI